MYYITAFKKKKVSNFKSFSEFTEAFETLTASTVETSIREKITYTFKYSTNAAFYAPMAYYHFQRIHNVIKNARELGTDLKSQYHFFEIPKASGGTRLIKAPNNDLKEMQRKIKMILEQDLKAIPHNAAWAYCEGRSIKGALEVHQRNNSKWFLKLDIKNFFDNCNPQFAEGMLSKIYPFSKHPNYLSDLLWIASLDNGLPQGTPLSPLLTNMLMVPFDYYLSMYAKRHGMVYTRYADDLLISSADSFEFQKVVAYVGKLFRRLDYPFELKEEKTRYGSSHGRNWNLGLMLNKDNEITLGHETKRKLKVILHKTATGDLPPNDDSVIGLFAYLKQIESNYFQGLNTYALRKYNRNIGEIINPK